MRLYASLWAPAWEHFLVQVILRLTVPNVLAVFLLTHQKQVYGFLPEADFEPHSSAFAPNYQFHWQRNAAFGHVSAKEVKCLFLGGFGFAPRAGIYFKLLFDGCFDDCIIGLRFEKRVESPKCVLRYVLGCEVVLQGFCIVTH